MKNAKLNILIIEDNRKHQVDAMMCYSSDFSGKAKVVFAKTYMEAERHLTSGKIDGVISDIHFPLSDNPNWSQPEPIGAMVMVLCKERGIPCILNTDGSHHGSRNQWICCLQRALGLPEIVDASDDHTKESPTKQWKKAFKALLGEIRKTKK
ncbi:MAG: hypothetical protein WC762_13705 [Methylobacter sp.]|jgi:hypothetical protein